MDQSGIMISMDQLSKFIGEEVIEKKVLRDKLAVANKELEELRAEKLKPGPQEG